ncbi:MAG: hypothetical protein P9L97_10690 [Candidatus Tenebribacter davisii]|jgi:thiol-disulfide isomerase/thioredoxin|nr:hypothetical protein [Candidatus Tenebribacter davisii]
MKKILLISLAVILVIIIACDRFEHELAPEQEAENWISDFFVEFADSIESILPAENVSNIMLFFQDDYNNNGLIKSDVEIFYEAFYYVNIPLEFEATLIDTSGYEIAWNLLVTSPDSEITFMDTLISDILIKTEDSYQFYGNQADMRNVMIEMFTAISCVNCPVVEEALHNLKEQYGSRLSYVEYHINDVLDPGNLPLLFYYGSQGSLPYTVINGNAQIITGSFPTVQQEIDDVILPLMEQLILVNLSDVETIINADSLYGSVQIELDPSISTDNLFLVTTLMEKLSTEHQNHNGENLHNIELKRETVSISSSGLQNFVIPDLDQLASGYQQLPDDIVLVLWVQTLENPYNQSTCTIYNVIEKLIDRR